MDILFDRMFCSNFGYSYLYSVYLSCYMFFWDSFFCSEIGIGNGCCIKSISFFGSCKCIYWKYYCKSCLNSCNKVYRNWFDSFGSILVCICSIV